MIRLAFVDPDFTRRLEPAQLLEGLRTARKDGEPNFVVYGVLLVLSAVGWYRFLTPERGAIWFPLLQGISGLCLIGAGVFSMHPFPGYPPGATHAPSTVHGSLHSILAWVIILTLAMGCFAFAQYARLAHWRGWFVYSLMTDMLILIFWGGSSTVRTERLPVWYRLLGWRSACQLGVTPSGFVCSWSHSFSEEEVWQGFLPGAACKSQQ